MEEKRILKIQTYVASLEKNQVVTHGTHKLIMGAGNSTFFAGDNNKHNTNCCNSGGTKCGSSDIKTTIFHP